MKKNPPKLQCPSDPPPKRSAPDGCCPADLSVRQIKDLPNFQAHISEISARMVKVSSNELDGEILRSLKEVFLLLNVDRGGLLEVSEDSPIIKVSHAWYGEGVEQVSSEINLADLFPWTYEKTIVQGRTMVMARHDDLPHQADVDRQSHELLGTKSALAIPLFIGLHIHHLMVLNAQNTERDWPPEIIMNMRLLGEILVSALYRRETEQELRKTNERFDLAAASADAGLWELNLETGLFWTTAKACELFGFDPKEELNLDRFLKAVHVDDRKLILDVIDLACRTGQEINIEYRVYDPAPVRTLNPWFIKTWRPGDIELIK